MDYGSARKLLKEKGQLQLLDYYDELDESRKKLLLEDIENIDFSVLEKAEKGGVKPRGKITPVQAVSVEEIAARRGEYEKAGLELLRQNKVGAVLLAGGQGSRLGYDGPKGTFDMGETREASIFSLQMDNVKKVAASAGAYFPVFVMTSVKNNAQTEEFFASHDYFGYPKEKIYFYRQNVAPSCGFDGKIFLDEKHRVSLTPNGNGGWYSSLISSEAGKAMRKEGVEWLNVYAVDNVLQQICDPVFIGATVTGGFGSGSKVVSKISPDEKVGVLCNEDGKPTIIEYYELPDELKYLEKDGELVYKYGVILNYLFKVKTLDGSVGELPYHVAEKAIAHIEKGVKVTPEKPCGKKFETLVVDMVKQMGSCLAYEVEREKEFAPVKNATGADSVETARALLKKNGVRL